MFQRQPKKMVAIQILDILRRHSSANHRLSQQDISRLLETEHNTKVDRGTIRRNLFNLVEYGYELEWREVPRKGPHGTDTSICTDWYIQRLFDDSQLRLLLDSLFFSRYIPPAAGKEMVQKLLTLSSRHFKAGVSSMSSLRDNALTNPQLFYTIDMLDEAINEQRKVTFEYNTVGIDKKMAPRRNRVGEVIRYLVNPYRMVVANGRHYLIANYDRYDNVAHFRIDRITQIQITEQRAKAMNRVRGLEKGLNLPVHMAEHLYMFSGDSADIAFVASATLMDNIIDWFGTGIKLENTEGGQITVRVRANKMAMRYWALQYAQFVTVLSPPDVAQEIRAALVDAAARYRFLDEGR